MLIEGRRCFRKAVPNSQILCKSTHKFQDMGSRLRCMPMSSIKRYFNSTVSRSITKKVNSSKKATKEQRRWLNLWLEQEVWWQLQIISSSMLSKEAIMALKVCQITRRIRRWMWASTRWWAWSIHHWMSMSHRRRRIWPKTTPSRQEMECQQQSRVSEEASEVERQTVRLQIKGKSTNHIIKEEEAVELWCLGLIRFSLNKWWLSSSNSFQWLWLMLETKANKMQATIPPTQEIHFEGKSNKQNTKRNTSSSSKCIQAATEFWIKGNRWNTTRIIQP